MTFRYAGFADEASRDLQTQIDTTHRASWNAIEVRMIGDKNVCDLSPAEWQQAWDRLQDGGINIPCFGSGLCNWARPITADFQVDVDELRRAAPRMHAAGCRLIRVMSYPNDPDTPLGDADWRREAARRLRELAAIAEGEGVVLAHENCSGYGGRGPDEIAALLDDVDSPAFKVIFDTGNSTAHDDDHEAGWAYYNAVRDEIVHIHIKSYKRGDDGALTTCFPDEDPLQARVLGDLKANGYDGWVSIEPHLCAAIHANKDIDDAEQAQAVYVDYARRLEQMVASLP